MAKRKKKIRLKKRAYIFILIILIGIWYLFFHYRIVFKLKGENSVKILENETYKEPGVIAQKCKLFTCENLSDIKTKDNIDNTKLGKYQVDYTLTYKNKEYNITREVRVIETVPPEIKLTGKDKTYICLNKEYIEPGYSASDNTDGDITKEVNVSQKVDTSKLGTYKVTYKVKDSSDNETTVTREVVVHDGNKDTLQEKINELENYIQEKNYHISIGYYNINSEYLYRYNASKVYYGASLIKTLDALYVYENLELNDTYRSLVKPAIEVSDNDAHRKLVNLIGIDNLREYGRKLGATFVLTNSNLDIFGNTTVNDQLTYIKHLYNFINDNSIPESKRTELKNYFINDYYNYLLFDGIPTTMHKYGYYGGYYHDVGIILDNNNPYIVVILTEEAYNDFKIVTDLSERIFELNNFVC